MSDDVQHLTRSPRSQNGNDSRTRIGLGQMNLHGYFARERIHYGSEEGLDFTNIYFLHRHSTTPCVPRTMLAKENGA